MMKRMVFGVACATTMALMSSIAAAAPLIYTLSGYGSYEQPDSLGNTGGMWALSYTGGDTANGNYQTNLPGTLTFTPYFVMGSSSPLRDNTLLENIPGTPGSMPTYLFAFALPGVKLTFQLSDDLLASQSLGTPFTLTLPKSDLAALIGNPIYTSDGSSGIIESISSDVTFSAALAPTAPVPEVSTWAMMLAGFGALGIAMRGSRQRIRRISHA